MSLRSIRLSGRWKSHCRRFEDRGSNHRPSPLGEKKPAAFTDAGGLLGCGLRASARLRVVLFALDATALLVLRLLDSSLLVRPHAAVGPCARFRAVDTRLTALELRGLAVGELPRLDALLDALLLVHVALNVGLHALRGGRIGIAFGGVVLEPVDLAAFLVLRALDARFLGRAERAVFGGVRFHAFDARFALLELRRFAGVERSAFQPLFDAALLVHVALHLRADCLGRSGDRKQTGDCNCDDRGCCFHVASLKFFMKMSPRPINAGPGHRSTLGTAKNVTVRTGAPPEL